MATSEALIKYYDCLRDSFHKIQDKDNKTALVNAALRPKIREEFAKSHDVLISYLNYVRVFSLIYSENFYTICSNIITPLFKEKEPQDNVKSEETNNKPAASDKADRVHESIKAIIESKPELTEDYVQSLVRVFPNIFDKDPSTSQTFVAYLNNCFKACKYLGGEPLLTLMSKILEKVNPPPIDDNSEEIDSKQVKMTLEKAYDLFYESIDSFEETERDRVTDAIITSYTREFLTSPNEDQFNYLLIYVCSFKISYADSLISSLWQVFVDTSKPLDERRVSVKFASSFIARAKYIDLERVFMFLEPSSSWCSEFIESCTIKTHVEGNSSENLESFYALAHSMFYLISQRYREMYEEETIARLVKLNLTRITQCHLKPLDNCDMEIARRFNEVATLYGLTDNSSTASLQMVKRRKSDRDSRNCAQWKVPFRETCNSVPERIQHIYRSYYDHRNFTVYRD